jgi:hypothetical protein
MDGLRKEITLNTAAKKLIANYRSPLKFIMGLLVKLPSIIFWGVRLKFIDAYRCEITIPYKWRSQNPFKSIYFAALAGAGELSTGTLCQVHLAGKGKWSMLVTDLRVEYLKKANSKITFVCEQGADVLTTLEKVENTGAPQTLTMVSTGLREDGLTVARVFITWSFKKKSS